jgi:hypothetical protein
MSLKDYNETQVEAIKQFVRDAGENPDVETETVKELEMLWVTSGRGDRFRAAWNKIKKEND